MGTLLAVVLLLSAPAPRAEEIPNSTAPASRAVTRDPGPVFGAPLRLRFLVDERGKPRGELGFSVRWNNADIPKLPGRAVRLVMDPFGTTERAAREALTGADIGIYTVHLKASAFLPIGLLLSPLVSAAGWAGPAALPMPEVGGVAPPPVSRPASTPRRRLSLTPAREEIERSLKRDLRRSLINAGFDLAVPLDYKVPFAQKQALYESLRNAERVLGSD